jgi:hypothetical protein
MLPYCSIHIFTWASPDGKTHNHTDHILTDGIQVYLMSDLSMERDCDTSQYLVVEELRDRLAVSKQGMQEFDMERHKLKKLKEAEGKKTVSG